MFRQGSEQIRSKLDAFHGVHRGALFLAAAVLLIGGLLYVTDSSPTRDSVALFGGKSLKQVELDQVELAFSQAGLSEWHREENQILVPQSRRHEYLSALEGQGVLPYPLYSNVGESLSSSSYFESDASLKRKLEFARAQDLGRKIKAFGDIAWASVEYDEHVSSGFDRKVMRSASVVLIPEDGKPLPPARIRMIQEFVRASYAGLQSEDVIVSDTCAGQSYGAASDPVERELRQREYELESKITKLLSVYEGIAVVASTRSEPGKESTVQLSIGVPERHLHSQCYADPVRNIRGAPSTKELESAREAVFANVREAVLPTMLAQSGGEQLHLFLLPDTPENLPQQATPVLPEFISATWVRENASVLGPLSALLLVAVAIGIMTLRLRLRSTHGDGATDAAVVLPIDGDSKRNEEKQDKVNSEAETTMRDELAELIESNPELAAQIVHGWLADAA